jgi:hypothetical protein
MFLESSLYRYALPSCEAVTIIVDGKNVCGILAKCDFDSQQPGNRENKGRETRAEARQFREEVCFNGRTGRVRVLEAADTGSGAASRMFAAPRLCPG